MAMTSYPPLDVVGLGYCAWDHVGIVDHVPEFDTPTVSLADFVASGGGPVSTYGLLHGWSLLRTATFANAVAALNCTALGGRAGLPRLGEVEAFLESHGHRFKKPVFCPRCPGGQCQGKAGFLIERLLLVPGEKHFWGNVVAGRIHPHCS